MRKILESCPACQRDLEVTQLSCPACDTVISGHFMPSRFNKLTPEHLQFAEMFIRLRGNIKDMEREMGLSYPTVRSRLNEVIRELGFDVGEDDTTSVDQHAEERQAILTRLERGEIQAEEAVKLLKKNQV